MLGYPSIGGQADSNDANLIDGSRFTTGAGGTVSSMGVYVNSVDAAPSNQFQVAIYADSNGRPGALVAQSASGTLSAGTWSTLPISATLSPNTAYWLVYNTNSSTPSLNNIAYDNNGAVPRAYTNSGVPPVVAVDVGGAGHAGVGRLVPRRPGECGSTLPPGSRLPRFALGGWRVPDRLSAPLSPYARRSE